jgi:hypothetical protein
VRTLVAIPLTLWLAVLVATPRRPLPDNEVAELVYGRLLGRYQRLVLLAGAATVAAVFVLLVALAHHAGATDAERADYLCADAPGAPPTCYRQLVGGWQEEQLQTDGTWWVMRTGLARPAVREKDQGLGG